MFKGSMAAMVTPFRGGKLDLPTLKEHAAFLLENGTDALVPLGTTGESPTLNSEERAEVLRVVLKAAKGKAPVVAGTGTNDTRTTVEYTRAAEVMGADAALSMAVDVRREMRPADPKAASFWQMHRMQGESRVTITLKD